MFSSELASMLIPEKEHGLFGSENDLNNSIIKRKQLMDQGKIMRDWVLKSTKEAMKNANPIIVAPTTLMNNLTLNLAPENGPHNLHITGPHNDLSTHFEPAIKTR